MKDVIALQGRELTPGDVEYIRRLLTENPTWSRRKLSIALCEAWDWRTATGHTKTWPAAVCWSSYTNAD